MSEWEMSSMWFGTAANGKCAVTYTWQKDLQFFINKLKKHANVCQLTPAAEFIYI